MSVNGRTGFLIQFRCRTSARLDQLAGDAALRRYLCQACNQHAPAVRLGQDAGQWAAVFERAWQTTPALRSTKSILNICPRAVAQP